MFTPHHVSHVTCHIHLFFSFLQAGEASQWRVCYQRGLPRLVFIPILLVRQLEYDALKSVPFQVLNRPGVAGAVLQTAS